MTKEVSPQVFCDENYQIVTEYLLTRTFCDKETIVIESSLI